MPATRNEGAVSTWAKFSAADAKRPPTGYDFSLAALPFPVAPSVLTLRPGRFADKCSGH